MSDNTVRFFCMASFDANQCGIYEDIHLYAYAIYVGVSGECVCVCGMVVPVFVCVLIFALFS